MADKEEIVLWVFLMDIGPHLSCHLSPSLNSWIQCVVFISGLRFI